MPANGCIMINSERSVFSPWHVVVVVLVLLAQPAAADTVKTVTIATTTVVDGQAHYTAASQRVIDAGWLTAQLRQRGVALVWVPVSGDTGPTINEAFASHRIDFGGYGDLPSIILNASGTRIQVVVPYGRGIDTFLLVPCNSSATSLKDLKGMRIAVHHGRPRYLTFLRLVEQSGLKPGDFTSVNIDIQPSVAAIASGNIDALFAINSYTVADRGLGWSREHAREYRDVRRRVARHVPPRDALAGLDELVKGRVDAVYAKGASAVEAARKRGLRVGIDVDAFPDRRLRANNGTPRPITVHESLLENHFDLVVRFLAQTPRTADWTAENLENVYASSSRKHALAMRASAPLTAMGSTDPCTRIYPPSASISSAYRKRSCWCMASWMPILT